MTISPFTVFAGARMENMQRFQQDFPAPTLHRLEQNYRSTTNILEAANALIANNTTRLGKNLWADGAAGEKLELYEAHNERDEARFVVERIQAARRDNVPLRDQAILYRVQRHLADAGRDVDARPGAVSRVRRDAILRTYGDQGRPGLPAPCRLPG